MRAPAAERGEVAFVEPERGELALRQVDAAAGEVFFHVAQDVGQLHRAAEVGGVGQRAIVSAPEHRRHHQPDHPSHAVAVEIELFVGGVPGLHQVHLHAVDQLLKRLWGNFAAHDGV